MKVGIMTMHRVQNVGSVLQAYALQHKMEQLGYEAEQIDYVFPPQREKHFSPIDIVNWGWNALHGFPIKRKNQKLESFRSHFLRCSEHTYYTREELLSNPPKYDIYCTGSDQVWNPRHVGDDTSFMLDFAPVGFPRMAYASSFASQDIEEPYFSLYSKHLNKYDQITVREKSGAAIVKRMTGKDAKVTCDPTLLLTSEEWEPVSSLSNITTKKDYILVYLLSYMFDPCPGFYNIVKAVQRATGLPVYLFNGYTKDRLYLRSIKYLGLGPADLVRLVKNSSFVITDSFHGTAFATIYNKPMIGVVKDENNGDGRIATLRNIVGGGNSVVCYNKELKELSGDTSFYQCSNERLEDVRCKSILELNKMLLKCKELSNS